LEPPPSRYTVFTSALVKDDADMRLRLRPI